jgi:uncharacterized membrane protein
MINSPDYGFESTPLSPQYMRGILAQSLMIAALATVHSLYVRGVRRTLLFAGFSLSLAAIGEAIVINAFHMLRHHTRPQIKGVPLGAVLGWYNISYASFATAERLIESWLPTTGSRRLPWATAAIATSLDLLMDCMAVDQGLWEWSGDGMYAPEIKGANGKLGIPISNFLGWIALTSSVVLLYMRAANALVQQPSKLAKINQGLASRGAALLLLPYYGEALIWAIQRRKFRYVLYSSLVPTVLLMALRQDLLAKLQSLIQDLERN